MTFVGKLRERKIWPEIQKRHRMYSAKLSPQKRKDWQLRQFNREWLRVINTVPYYKRLRQENKVPEEFRNWGEFVERVPVTNRLVIKKNLEQMQSYERPPQWWRITGGTTAQPIQIPAWKSERSWLSPELWSGRYQLGVRPGDRAFWIWGHSHLLGSGVRGWISARKRELYDWLLGYYRYSAYDLQREKMRHAGDVLLRFHPKYVLAYSVALDSFARANQDRSEQFRKLGLKVAIGLAEAFPTSDSPGLISDVLGAPVTMEYGSVETGVMAALIPGDAYHVYWRSYFLEGTDSGIGGGKIVRVTSLYPRCFPLVRYEHGDEIEMDELDLDGFGISKFKRVVGRCNDFVEMLDGGRIHSEVFTHAVRGVKEIDQYQVLQKEPGNITMFVKTETPLPKEIVDAIRHRLKVVHSDLAGIQIASTEKFRQTVAGKTPMVIRKH